MGGGGTLGQVGSILIEERQAAPLCQPAPPPACPIKDVVAENALAGKVCQAVQCDALLCGIRWCNII